MNFRFSSQLNYQLWRPWAIRCRRKFGKSESGLPADLKRRGEFLYCKKKGRRRRKNSFWKIPRIFIATPLILSIKALELMAATLESLQYDLDSLRDTWKNWDRKTPSQLFVSRKYISRFALLYYMLRFNSRHQDQIKYRLKINFKSDSM